MQIEGSKASQVKQTEKNPVAINSIFEQFAQNIRTRSTKLKDNLGVFKSHFKDYADVVDSKVENLNEMWDYDINYQIEQKYSKLWKNINTDRLSYLDSEDRLSLNSKLKELRNNLEQIETDQNNQRQFIMYLYKIFRKAKQRFQKHEKKDVGTQVALEGVNPEEFAEYEKAEKKYK